MVTFKLVKAILEVALIKKIFSFAVEAVEKILLAIDNFLKAHNSMVCTE